MNRAGRIIAVLCFGVWATACHGEISTEQSETSPGSTSEEREPTAPYKEPQDGEPQEGEVTVERPEELPVYGEPGCRPPDERLWQLTPMQLSRTYEQLQGSQEVNRLQSRLTYYSVLGEPFSADPSLINASTLMMSEVLTIAREIGEGMIDDPAPLDACLNDAEPDEACRTKAFSDLAELIWRRPIEDEELERVEAFYDQMASLYGAPSALRLTVRRLLSAPGALYRSERGELNEALGVRELSTYEIADQIAYTLTDAPPDEALRQAAASGTLRDPGQVAAHVQRILEPQPSRDDSVAVEIHQAQRIYGLMRFFREWLEVDDVEEAIKPDVRKHVINAYYSHLDRKDKALQGVPSEERAKRWLDNEMMLFVRRVLWEGEGTLKALLTSDETYYSKTLSAYYGFPLDARPDGVVAPMQHGRRGLLMQGGFLLAHDSTSSRGLFIRTKLLCQPVDEPLDDIDMDLDGQSEALAMGGMRPNPREVRRQHLESPACAGCHASIDPLGFPFDGFDEYGVERTLWDGYAIDTQGEITDTDLIDGPVATPQELIETLADSSQVRACFVRQLFTFVHGREPGEGDSCVLKELTEGFEQSGGAIRPLMEQMLEHQHTWQRMPLFDTDATEEN